MKQNWQPMKYSVSKRELMKEYNKAIETSRRPPDWLNKRLRKAKREGRLSLIAKQSPAERSDES